MACLTQIKAWGLQAALVCRDEQPLGRVGKEGVKWGGWALGPENECLAAAQGKPARAADSQPGLFLNA
jgi:hypothetical protein